MEIMLSLAAVPLSQAREYVAAFQRDGIAAKTIRRFAPHGSKGYRIYLPIDTSLAKRKVAIVPQGIQDAVAEAGYVVEDYLAGMAMTPDGKKRIRIGKLLKDHKELADQFKKDPQRNTFKNEAFAVVSCHPYDIAGMSTGRSWTSCMNLNDGVYNEHVIEDVKGATLVAYAIEPNDTNIQKPKSRFLIKMASKPGDPHDVMYVLEAQAYGADVPGFRETLERWLKIVNHNVTMGVYRFSDRLYEDGVGMAFANVPTVAEIEGDPYTELSKFADEIYHHPESVLAVDWHWFPHMLRLTIEHKNGLTGLRCRALWRNALNKGAPLSYVGSEFDRVLKEKKVKADVIQKLATTISSSGEMAGYTSVEMLRASTIFRDWLESHYDYDNWNGVLRSPKDMEFYTKVDPRWLERTDFESIHHDDYRANLLNDIIGQRILIQFPFNAEQEYGNAMVDGLRFMRAMYDAVPKLKTPVLQVPKGYTDQFAKLKAAGLRGGSVYRADNREFHHLEAVGAFKALENGQQGNRVGAVFGAMLQLDIEWARDCAGDFSQIDPILFESFIPKLIEMQKDGVPPDEAPIAFNILIAAEKHWDKDIWNEHFMPMREVLRQVERYGSWDQQTKADRIKTKLQGF